jgi:hypothetical protein
MKTRNKIAIGLIFFILVNGAGACASKPTSTPPETAAPAQLSMLSAVLSEVTGKVEIKQAREDAFTSAQNDSFVNENGQVKTGDDGRVRLNLSTGTIIRIAPASLFTLTSNKSENGNLKTSGKLTLGQLFVILKGGSLDVETPTGTAAVRGSYMSVDYDPVTGEVKVTCLEGHCSLSNTNGSVDITAGQTAVITGTGQPPQVGQMSEEDIQNWLNSNPEAQFVVPEPTQPPATEPPATQPPATEPPVKELHQNNAPSSGGFSGTINKPEEGGGSQLTPTPSLTPTVVIGNIVPTSTVVGEPLTIAISVLPSSGGPTPTGTVSVSANGTGFCTASLSSGTATCVGGIPFAGNSNLVANYSGDINYVATQSSASVFTVGQASTTTTITNSTPNPSLVNTSVIFTATVDNVAPGAGLPTGSVTFHDSDYVDTCTATSAPWSCSITFTNPGSIAIAADYSGNANFTGSSSSYITQDVLSGVNSEFLDITAPPVPTTLTSVSQCSQLYEVKVLDINGINQVSIEYSINNSSFTVQQTIVPLTNIGSNTWQRTISIPTNISDVVYWRFIAVDTANNSTFFGGSPSPTPYTLGYPATSPTELYSFAMDNLTSCP